MIEITPNIRSRFPAAFKKARKERIRCVRLQTDLYYVARYASGHGQYLVRFFEVPGVNETKVKVLCKTIDGEPCNGAWGERMCAHIAKAIESGVRHGRKKQRQAA